MAITPFSAVPSRQQAPANFATTADAFLSEFPRFVTEANTLIAETNGIKDATETIRVATEAIRDTTQGYMNNAASSAAAASASEDVALGAANSATASAASAVNAPGTSATSTTSMTISMDAKTLTIQTGKQFVPGQFLVVASTVSPINYMLGQITAYNTATGQLDLSIYQSGGSGTYDSWNVAMSAVSNAYLPSAKIFFMMGR